MFRSFRVFRVKSGNAIMYMLVHLIVSICVLALVLLFVFSNSSLCIALIPVLITIIPILFFLLNRKPVNDFLEGYNPGRMADNDYHYALVQLFNFIYQTIAITAWAFAIILIFLYIMAIGASCFMFNSLLIYCFLYGIPFISVLFVLHTILGALIGLIDRIPSFGALFFVNLFLIISWLILYLSFLLDLYASC